MGDGKGHLGSDYGESQTPGQVVGQHGRIIVGSGGGWFNGCDFVSRSVWEILQEGETGRGRGQQTIAAVSRNKGLLSDGTATTERKNSEKRIHGTW